MHGGLIAFALLLFAVVALPSYELRQQVRLMESLHASTEANCAHAREDALAFIKAHHALIVQDLIKQGHAYILTRFGSVVVTLRDLEDLKAANQG